MDSSIGNQPPPELGSNWHEISSLSSQCCIESWWDTYSKWITLSLYDQIHKIELLEVWVDGVQVNRTEQYTLEELKELATSNSLPSCIVYKRRLYPKDYLRKKEVDDCAYHFLDTNQVVYKPYVPNNDPQQLAYFYVQAFATRMSLLGIPSLREFWQSNIETSQLPIEQHPVKLDVIPFGEGYHFPEKLKKVGTFYVKCLDKWDKSFRGGGYRKKFHHDVLVPLDHFTSNYRRLKEKYNYWVETWEESTDPAKFVFEDIGIAAFLISIWQVVSPSHKPTFVDVGCGNGFLVYILVEEGYTGRGIDLVRRKIWSKYPEAVKLEEAPIDPTTCQFEEDWILANHSDELTPWIPFIASRNNRKFFVLPCCEWNFDCRFTTRTKTLSRYEGYLEYVKLLTQKSGYNVEVEHLRIPSTRNIAIVGQTRTIDINDNNQIQEVLNNQQECLAKAKFNQFVARVAPPKSHVTKKRAPKTRDRGFYHPSNMNGTGQPPMDGIDRLSDEASPSNNE